MDGYVAVSFSCRAFGERRYILFLYCLDVHTAYHMIDGEFLTMGIRIFHFPATQRSGALNEDTLGAANIPIASLCTYIP